jgi:hypothetical protein
MNTAVTLDNTGQRTLRPRQFSAPLRKERGVWTFRTGKKLSAAVADKVLRESRGQIENRG